MSSSENRIIYLDRLRILASFLVVIIHISALFFYNYTVDSSTWMLSTFFNCMARTAVPLFIFISGAIYLGTNKNITIKKLLYNIIRIIIIFILWDFIYALRDNINDLSKVFISMINYKYHLWYLLTYISLLSLVPILKLICKENNKIQVKYLLILFFCGTCIFEMLRMILNLFDSTSSVVKLLKWLFDFFELFNIGNIPSYLILFISGWYFSTFDFSTKKKTVLILLPILILIIPVITITLCRLVGKEGFELASNFYYLPCYLLTITIFLAFR